MDSSARARPGRPKVLKMRRALALPPRSILHWAGGTLTGLVEAWRAFGFCICAGPRNAILETRKQTAERPGTPQMVDISTGALSQPRRFTALVPPFHASICCTSTSVCSFAAVSHASLSPDRRPELTAFLGHHGDEGQGLRGQGPRTQAK